MLDGAQRDVDGVRPFRLSGELTEAEVRAAYEEAMRCVEGARRRREHEAECGAIERNP